MRKPPARLPFLFPDTIQSLHKSTAGNSGKDGPTIPA